MIYKINLEKLKQILSDGEKYYKNGYKALFCYATRIEEHELDKLLEEKEIDFSAIQNICQYSSLSLQDFFEKVI